MLKELVERIKETNGIEAMIKANPETKDKLVKLIECIALDIGPSTEFLLSEIRGYLKHNYRFYNQFVKTEEDEIIFYNGLNLFLEERIENYNSLKKGFSKNKKSKPIGKTFDALHILNIGIDLKDNYTMKHMKDVALYSEILGRYLGLNLSDITLLKSAALEHDIGKITIPYEVLNKPGQLNSDELAIMRRHTENGERILANLIPFEEEGREKFLGLVGSHHTYYCDIINDKDALLKGIVAGADAFSAMNTDRPYRKKMHYDMIIDEFKKNSGKQFHPEVVKAIVEKNVLKKYAARN